MIKLAKQVAQEAGEIILKRRFVTHSVKRKDTKDNIVTEADVLAEKEILRILTKEFPKHNYITEESGKINNDSEFTWVIDPLDGTGPYFSGLPTYGVSIGLLKKGLPHLGVLHFPTLDSTYWAEKGKGAFMNGKRIKVSGNSDLKDVMVGFDLGWMGKREGEVDNLIKPLVDKVRYTPILGCTISGLAYVAQGIYGGYIHWAYPWDFVGGVVIIEEAGGKVTDYQRKQVNWLKKDMQVFASNGLVHDKILRLINK